MKRRCLIHPKAKESAQSDYQLYEWLQSHTLTSKYDGTSMEELKGLCSYIHVTHKHDKIIRYLKDIHAHHDINWDGDTFQGIKLVHKTINTIDDLKDAITFLSDLPQVHACGKEHEYTIISCDDHVYRVDIQRKQLSYAGVCYSYQAELDLVAKLADLQSSTLCQSCNAIIPMRANTNKDQCRRCQRRNMDRNNAAAKTAARNTLNDITNTFKPQFADHIRNQLQRQDSPNNAPYNKGTFNLSLRTFLRNKTAYMDLRADGSFGQLPSPQRLSQCKNKITQRPGILPEMLSWMTAEAAKLKVGTNGRKGGLIFDETSLQPELTLSSYQGAPMLYGFECYGPHVDGMRDIYNPQADVKKANKVLQFLFTGFSGLKFPFAHYPVCSTDTRELRALIDEAITALATYDFQVMYVMCDGFSTNRSLVKQVETISKTGFTYSAPHPSFPHDTITYIMDPKHTIKKIRNSLLTSGSRLRLIRSELGVIPWDHWIRLYQWSAEGSLKLSKLTEPHIRPDSTEKMRNHLAEEALNLDCLNSMKLYQKSLHKPDELTATVELLEMTSSMVRFFLDPAPITSVRDQRLAGLERCAAYFSQFTGKPTTESFTAECVYDTICSLRGIIELINLSLKAQISVVPARLNSDVIENHFSMVRSLYNGANNHPSYFSYKSLQTSVIITQPVGLSRKRNAASTSPDVYVNPPP